MSKKDISLLIGIVSALIISRLIPHAPNFTSSLTGLVFGGVVLRKGFYGVLILLAYFIADLAINNIHYSVDHTGFQWASQSFYWIYAGLVIVFFISRLFTENLESPFRIMVLSLASSLIFFLLSNFGVWLEGVIYVKDFSGLFQCFIAGLPFLLNDLAASVFFGCVFFGIYWLYESSQEENILATR
ncbi:MAG: DUF6580 family putative transport protein [Saprospiraceae bacterium]